MYSFLGIQTTWMILRGWHGSVANSEIQRVDVLPFHQMGRFKWKELKLDYTLSDAIPPSRELVQQACARFRTEGLKAY
jgi:pyruvate formate lyase activating enzyme